VATFDGDDGVCVSFRSAR